VRELSFRLEKEMLEPTLASLIKLLTDLEYIDPDKHEVMVASELSFNYRIIDIAVAVWHKNAKDSLDNGPYSSYLKKLNNKQLFYLSKFTEGKPKSIQYFKNKFFVDFNTAKNELEKLEKYGLISKESKFTYKATPWVSELPQEIIAIELKLSDWNEALEQSKYNLDFADYSFAVLDSSRLPQRTNIEEIYEDNNVGLIYLSSDSEIVYANIPSSKSRNIQFDGVQKVKFLKDYSKNFKWKELKAAEII